MRWALLLLSLGLAPTMAVAQQNVTVGDGAVLRTLEKISGNVTEFTLVNGESFEMGRMTVTLRACRYPPENPAGEAFAYLTIWEEGGDQPEFDGWMIASSPALNALEHPRYDVWVLRCKTD
jgi:hypothetical protein